MKYVPADKLGGEDAKATIEKLTDAFCDFIYSVSDDQESVMDTVLTLFNGRGGLKKIMSDTIIDKQTMYAAFKYFVFTQSADLEKFYNSLVLTDKDLFDNLRNYLQSAINTWREDEVKAKLPDLVKELGVIFVLNMALGVTEKTYRSIQTVLNNVLEHMKIPGTVVETLGYSWIPSMKLMRCISKTAWSDVPTKNDILEALQAGAKAAWEILSQPKIILETVLNKRNVSCSDEEISSIYTDLKPTVYENLEQVFYTTLDKLLESVSYRRNVAEVKRLWNEKSQTNTVRQWCNKANCPIIWLFDSSDVIDVATITMIQDDKPVDKNALDSAFSFLKCSDLSILFDSNAIASHFFANIGESYRAAFETDGTTLYARLKTNDKLTSDVYSWPSKIPEIKKVLNDFLKDKHQKEVKERIKSMPDAELRSDVLRLLENQPELYSYFLKI